MRIGCAIAELHVVALIQPEIAEAMRGEDQLAGKAQQVHRVRSVRPPPGAMGLIPFPQQNVFVRPGAKAFVFLLAQLFVDPAGLLGP